MCRNGLWGDAKIYARNQLHQARLHLGERHSLTLSAARNLSETLMRDPASTWDDVADAVVLLEEALKTSSEGRNQSGDAGRSHATWLGLTQVGARRRPAEPSNLVS